MLGATEWLSAVPPRDHIAAPPIPPKSAMSPSGTTRPAADTLVPLPARPRPRAAVFRLAAVRISSKHPPTFYGGWLSRR